MLYTKYELVIIIMKMYICVRTYVICMSMYTRKILRSSIDRFRYENNMLSKNYSWCVARECGRSVSLCVFCAWHVSGWHAKTALERGGSCGTRAPRGVCMGCVVVYAQGGV